MTLCSQIHNGISRWVTLTAVDYWLIRQSVSSFSCMRVRVMNHNWSATKQRLHLQSVAEISRHSVLSRDRIRQCGTSSGYRHKDTDQCLQVSISFCRHRSVPVPCKNGSAETTVAEGGQNPVAGLWGRTLRIDYLSWLPVMPPSTFDVNWLQVQPQQLPGCQS